MDLDIQKLAPEVATILLACGTERSELRWHTHPWPYAGKKLDELDDAKLFAPEQCLDDKMVVAVRSLLFLWNGFPAEAAMLAECANDSERLYLTGLCYRQLGQYDHAKASFRALSSHAIFAELGTKAVSMIHQAKEPLVMRLKEYMRQCKAWEPNLYIDLFEHAASDKAGLSSVLVGRLQDLEFEMLFVHCYEKVVGHPVPRSVDRDESSRRLNAMRSARRRAGSGRRQQAPPSKPKAEAKATAVKEPPKKAAQATVNVACPKCGQIGAFVEALRGKSHRCTKCSVLFAIPKK